VNPSDLLRQARSSGYGSKGESGGEGSRSFPLLPEENIPDGPCCVKAYGTAQGGKFVIDRIEPEQMQKDDREITVKTPTQVSPS